MTERSVSIFLLTGPIDNPYHIREWRTFTTDDTVPAELLTEESIEALHMDLFENSAPLDYIMPIVMGLDNGDTDFSVEYSGTTTRVVVIENTPATSFVQVRLPVFISL